jgi:hypothetical protein
MESEERTTLLIDDLPEGVLLLILSLLQAPEDLAAAACVCTRWCALSPVAENLLPLSPPFPDLFTPRSSRRRYELARLDLVWLPRARAAFAAATGAERSAWVAPRHALLLQLRRRNFDLLGALIDL